MIYITGDTHGTRDFYKLLDDRYKLSPKIRVAFWCKRQWHNSDVRGRIGALCA